jgi:CTD kinase subunit beta
MLEASGFDFRVRYPQKHLIKLCKEARMDKDVSKVAYNMMIDLYKTFAPIKQSCAAMSFACVELATLVLGKQQAAIHGERSPKYRKWRTTRGEVIEAILDLLDLYTHFQKLSLVGPQHPIEKFLQIRLKVNQEVEQHPPLTRYTQEHEPAKANGLKLNVKTPKTPVTPASPADVRVNGVNGTNGKDNSPATMSPRSSGSSKRGAGARGQDGTVRFMLDAAEAKREKDAVAEYFKVEYEDYEIEVEEPIKIERKDPAPRTYPRNDRNERPYYHNKRARR